MILNINYKEDSMDTPKTKAGTSEYYSDSSSDKQSLHGTPSFGGNLSINSAPAVLNTNPNSN
jgi:hypothetical protein